MKPATQSARNANKHVYSDILLSPLHFPDIVPVALGPFRQALLRETKVLAESPDCTTDELPVSGSRFPRFHP